MATLTAAQIKTILEGAVYPVDEGVEINAALMQNEERRKYPSIDVQNVTGEEFTKDYPSKTIGQTFLVHLFYRYRSFGEQHEPDIKVLEDIIFDTLDAAGELAVPGVKITVTQGWRRQSETFPVHRSHSILTVTSEELESTDGGGIPGDKIEITIPGVGTFTVISMSDGRSINKQMDLAEDAERIFTKISNTDLLIVELQLDATQEAALDTIVHAGDDVSTVDLDKNGTVLNLVANFTSMVASSTRAEVQTTLVTMDIKN